MQKLIFSLSFSLFIGVFVLQGQSELKPGLQQALGELSLAHSFEAYQQAAEHFEQLAQENPQSWLPVYYAILAKSWGAHLLPSEKAIAVAEHLEAETKRLFTLEPDRSEALTLKGFVQTIKVAVEPMQYGMRLSPEIIRNYREALTLDPKNPRAVYLLGEYEMKSAPYYGKDPRESCGRLIKAKQLFAEQVDKDMHPSWGEERVDQLLKTACAK